MNFNEAFLKFKQEYSSTPRVVQIRQNEFGFDDIAVLYYDKYNKNPPINFNYYEGFRVDTVGVCAIKETFETIVDIIVLNDPNSWDGETQFYHHLDNIRTLISKYELGLL